MPIRLPKSYPPRWAGSMTSKRSSSDPYIRWLPGQNEFRHPPFDLTPRAEVPAPISGFHHRAVDGPAQFASTIAGPPVIPTAIVATLLSYLRLHQMSLWPPVAQPWGHCRQPAAYPSYLCRSATRSVLASLKVLRGLAATPLDFLFSNMASARNGWSYSKTSHPKSGGWQSFGIPP